jgi:DNA-binding response OmpR family regulator
LLWTGGGLGPLLKPKKRILVVDDDPDIREGLATALSDAYEVFEARDGAAALAILEVEPMDAILLDLMMPVLDGPAMVHAMRARDLHVPVILISAGTDLVRKARDLRAHGYVAKPFDLELLEAKLAHVLEATP